MRGIFSFGEYVSETPDVMPRGGCGGWSRRPHQLKMDADVSQGTARLMVCRVGVDGSSANFIMVSSLFEQSHRCYTRMDESSKARMNHG